MVLTDRDRRIITGVYQYRVLRRDQIQALFFPGKSKTAVNRVLSRLFQHSFLKRHIPPIQYGQGFPQSLYLLEEKGANVVAEELGIDRAEVNWQPHHNQVSSMFLEHTLRSNDIRIAFVLAAEQAGHTLKRWIDESTLKGEPDYVHITTPSGKRRKVAVIPDAYFTLTLDDRTASFFLEVDRATVSNRRWQRRIKAYMKYVLTGKYQERYQTAALRVLTSTTTDKRLQNLKATTQQAIKEANLPGLARLFWFTTHEGICQNPGTLFSRPLWQVAGISDLQPLIAQPAESDSTSKQPANPVETDTDNDTEEEWIFPERNQAYHDTAIHLSIQG